jgi:DNA invertase Pin-like site-specific DNA recombinase
MANKEANAIILARVSSKSQEDEGYSLDSQLKLLTGYCDSKQLNVIKVFKIAETASKEQSRKVFHELLAYLAKGNIFHLTVEKTDRLTRNFRDAVAINTWLEEDPRRRLHAVKESLLLHKEAKSDMKFMWNIHLSVAQKYTDNLREEAMKGWAEKIAQGWLPAVPPPGYMTVVENGKHIHIPNPETKYLIQRIFEFYLDPNQSIATVCEEMQRLGITTRKGRPYVKSSVQKMLTNPFYIGINRFNGKDTPGAQETFISKVTFDKVQNKMRRKGILRYRHHNPVFKNVICCSNCGGMVTWQLQKDRYYGTCQRKDEACKGRSLLREDKLEEQITTMLNSLVSPSEEVIEWVAKAMRERHKVAIENNGKLVSSIKTQIERINRMDSNLYDDKLAGDITADRYNDKHTELANEKAGLEERLSKIDQNLGLKLEQKLVLLELSQKAAALYPKKSPEHKRIIITKLFDQLDYKDGSISVKYTNFARAIAHNVKLTRNLIGGTI